MPVRVFVSVPFNLNKKKKKNKFTNEPTFIIDVSYSLVLLSRLLGHFFGHKLDLNGPFSFPLPVSLGFNAFGFIFLTFAIIVFNFPSESPVNKDSMNYTSAAIGVIGVVALITWFTTARTQFAGPSGVRDVVHGIDDTSGGYVDEPVQDMQMQDEKVKDSK